MEEMKSTYVRQVAQLEGTLVEKAVDPEAAAHFASEAANPDASPEEGKERHFELTATSVRVKAEA